MEVHGQSKILHYIGGTKKPYYLPNGRRQQDRNIRTTIIGGGD